MLKRAGRKKGELWERGEKDGGWEWERAGEREVQEREERRATRRPRVILRLPLRVRQLWR